METIIFNGRNDSGSFNLNLLCNEENIYLMDNHFAAGWCWLQQVDLNEQYHFLHIDKHYDLSKNKIDCRTAVLQEQNIDIANITIQQLAALRYRPEDMPDDNITHPIFLWDNYIAIINKLYPDLIASNTFATQKDGDTIEEMEINEVDAWQLQENLSFWINRNDNQWIVNLDIDYFFTSYDEDNYFQLYTDDFIVRIAQEIRRSIRNIRVLTIALSPEICGGWENSERVAGLVLQELGIDYPVL